MLFSFMLKHIQHEILNEAIRSSFLIYGKQQIMSLKISTSRSSTFRSHASHLSSVVQIFLAFLFAKCLLHSVSKQIVAIIRLVKNIVEM
jgi:hypothetical protein